MEDIKEEIKELLEEVERDDDAKWATKWQVRAVEVLNEYNFETNRFDDEIWDTETREWDELVIQQADNRGARGVMHFLANLSVTDEWASLDGYGNAVAVTGSDMLEMLKDAMQEIEHEQ